MFLKKRMKCETRHILLASLRYLHTRGNVRLHWLTKHIYTASTQEAQREEVVMPRLYLHSHSCTRDNISTTSHITRVRVKTVRPLLKIWACGDLQVGFFFPWVRVQSCLTGFVMNVKNSLNAHTHTLSHTHAITHTMKHAYRHKHYTYSHIIAHIHASQKHTHTYASSECG